MIPLIAVFGELNQSQIPGLQNYAGLTSGGLTTLISIILKLLVVVASLWTLFQIVFAGYGFISAGGDPKAIESAWSKVWQSLVGLTVVAGSFILAAIFGYLIFGDAGAILNPKIYTP